MDCVGIHAMIYNAIMDTDIEMRRQLFGNIILAGGTTMTKGKLGTHR